MPDKWEDHRHPSWGKVNISRVSGHTTLFRSALTHHNYIEMTISKAKVVDTTGASDFVMEDGQLITVAMSETQFARMISSLNIGEGSPCTLVRCNGERMPDCPPEDRKGYVKASHDDHLDNNSAALAQIGEDLQEMLDRKHRPTLKEMAELIHRLRCSSGNFDSNQDYYRERFAEDMERITEEAKTEIEAHIVNAVARVGLEHLQDQMPRLHSTDKTQLLSDSKAAEDIFPPNKRLP